MSVQAYDAQAYAKGQWDRFEALIDKQVSEYLDMAETAGVGDEAEREADMMRWKTQSMMALLDQLKGKNPRYM